MNRSLTTIVAILIYAAYGFAQNPMLRNYRTSDYQGGTQNWCIDKTSDNRLLMANNKGLLEYDSRWWRLFPLKNYSNVRSILFDKDKMVVWAGGSEEFGYYSLSASNFSVQYHSLSDSIRPDEREFDEIWRIVKWDDKVVFQGKSRIFFYRDNKLSSLSTPFIIQYLGVCDDKLLVASHEEVFQLTNGKLQKLEGTETLSRKNIRAIMTYQGEMIFATSNDGLFRYNGKTVTPFLQQLTPFVAKNRLFCAAVQNDQLALGTVKNGLLLYNIKTGQTLYVNRETGLQNNTVLSIRFDEQHNVWLGLDQGVSYIMPGFPSSHLLGNMGVIGTGYASMVANDKLFLGTNQGLFTIPYPLISLPTPPTPQPVEPLTGQIWNLTELHGTLFCGADAGTYVLNGQSATKIDGPEGTWNFISLRGRPDQVMGCDYKGLFLLRKDNGRWLFDGRVDGFSHSSADFLQANDGTIWLSHWQKGVYRLTLSPDAKRVVKTELYNSKNGLLVEENNIVCRIGDSIYISSVDGFYSYDKATKKLKHADRITNIFQKYDVALRLYETPSHDIWAHKPGYLALAHRKADGTYSVDSISYKNIEQELQMIFGRPGFVSDKQTILNSINGFFLVNNHYQPQPNPAHVVFQGIAGTNHGDTLLYACNPMPHDYVYRIPHEENSIRFHFVMPEYARPQEIAYAYWLEGYDKGWSMPQSLGEKEYTKLPKGSYVFHVRATNRSTGVTDEQCIKIYIEPAWYETWWAYIAYLIIAIVIVWLLVGWMKRIEQRKLRELTAKKEEEMRKQKERFQLEQERKEMKLREQQARLEAEEQRRKHEVAQLQNEQLENELKHRQSELADSTMNLMRKNDMLQELDEQMNQLSESVRREDAKAKITQKIKDIRHDIQQNINEDEGWDKFEENFNLVYDNFMKRLIAQFPELKMNDRKLCAYLRMGLSSKEMASLLNTSVRSIETARYRLRKKLDMEQGDNLTEFIQNF